MSTWGVSGVCVSTWGGRGVCEYMGWEVCV